MSEILKKFDKKFKRYNFDFSRKFIYEQLNKKNSDLMYIYQYKNVDEVVACLEQLKDDLEENYYFLIDNPSVEANNERLSLLKNQIAN